jgi:hypothetical protein
MDMDTNKDMDIDTDMWMDRDTCKTWILTPGMNTMIAEV